MILIKKGFTLVEVLVTIAVFSFIIGLIGTFILMIYKTHDYTIEQSMAVNEARRGVETMVMEIREAKTGDDGSYPIISAEDKEFIFYSNIDSDDKVERVRYFLGRVSSGEQIKECQSSSQGGSCGVVFSDFLKGTLISAQVKVSADGDLGWNNKEYIDVYSGVNYLGQICKTGCLDCLGSWQGTKTFDVTDLVADNSISFLAQASSKVDPLCPYSMKVKFEFSWTEDLGQLAHQFKKGVIKPVVESGGKISYPLEDENVTVLTSYVRNVPPIFKYFDENGQEIIESPARLIDTKLIEVHLIINIDPNKAPGDFELKSSAQLRNLKEEY